MSGVPPLRVLLVEDNDFTRSTVGAALEAQRLLVVASVPTAFRAMEVARTQVLDCAVIDLHLGNGPTGLDLAHALRKNDPDLGIVILTSFEDPRLLSADQRPLPSGGVYVVKNQVTSTKQLRDAVERACGPTGTRAVATTGRVPLTDNQVEILRMVAEGLTNAEIARRRVTTDRAVESSLARIAQRLGIEANPNVNTRVRLAQAYFAMIGGSRDG